ncbi:nucleotidyl transferase AbiEii/AbiGii toxin family protein [Sporichthya sp.]|uniref:nucleotidyl transferase AbiEii/AbiGii toxin family protein n=1 Tax=Sporichthya sp. TaxID=65475 RepID=UPI0017AEAFF0|nr:nucleotidyl transferase AbiEii/AbiGii toxin family protein [Sporichthya sp.]MBA3741984.1 nucleotidyl transferase AbiEii/AbiGii toxin family protein [Sporichthya sp.]
MTPTNRSSAAGRAYLDLRALARSQGRGTEELLVLFTLERFLYRVSISEHRERVVLKGGMLLAAMDERRPTRDVDMLATATSNDVDQVSELVREIAGLELDDGVYFDVSALSAATIRDNDQYGGVRITVPARLDRARPMLRVDVSVGDPVTPRPIRIDYPALLGGTFALRGYPLETVLAEKIVTMIDRGDTNTRDRDFADVVLLTARHPIGAEILRAALAATANHRSVVLRPLGEVLVNLAEDRQRPWEDFLQGTGLNAVLPRSFGDAIARVVAFADPILASPASSGRWAPAPAAWLTEPDARFDPQAHPDHA